MKIKQFIILWIFWAQIFSLCQAVAQTTNDCQIYANKQFKDGNYSAAILEFQRYLFFSNQPSDAAIYIQLGDCYHKTQQYTKATRYYEFACLLSNNDSIKYEAIFKKTVSYLVSGNFRFAQIEMLQLADTIPLDLQRKKQFYLGIVYFGLNDFEQSRLCFIHSLDTTCTQQIQAIKEIFSHRRNFYRPNPNLAMGMSIILPGSGQIYAGDLKNGLNSLALTGGLLALGLNVAQRYSYFDALMAVFPWFSRYYQGGYKHAKQIAIHKRAERRNKTYKSVLQIIDNKTP